MSSYYNQGIQVVVANQNVPIPGIQKVSLIPFIQNAYDKGLLNFNAIPPGSIDFTEIQNINSGRLLGRYSAGSGIIEEIKLGTGLSFTGDTLNAAGGSPAGSNGEIQFNNSGAFGASSNLFWDNATKTLKIKSNGTADVDTVVEIKDSADRVIYRIANSGIVEINKANNALTQNTAVIKSVGSDADIGLALMPKGNGAITAQVPDGTVTGGNARGQYAVDLQMLRVANTQVASGQYSTMAGVSNTASGQYSTVGGGVAHTASGPSSTVAGGYYNKALAQYSTVAGGYNSTASGYSSTVAGGFNNTASATSSTVAGGEGNTASAQYSTVAGGYGNTASAQNSTVAGGFNNTASGHHSFATNTENYATGIASSAFGRQAKAYMYGQHSIGVNVGINTFGHGQATMLPMAQNSTGTSDFFVKAGHNFAVGEGTGDNFNPDGTNRIIRATLQVAIVCNDKGNGSGTTGDVYASDITFTVKKVSNNISILASPVEENKQYDSSMSDLGILVTADNATKEVKIQVRPPSSAGSTTKYRAVATLRCTEVAW